MDTHPLSLRLEPELKRRLETVAKEDERSLSFIAHQAIESYLDGRDEKRKAMSAAFAESEAGPLISDEAMMAWVESWGERQEKPKPKPDLLR